MEFTAGSTHTAKTVMRNPTSAPFDYQGILYMGVNQSPMALKNFHLEAGQSEEVSFPVGMPTGLGSYPVCVGVFSDDRFLEPLRQGENVTIIAVPPPAPFAFSNLSAQRTRCQSATAWNTLNFGCTITNPTSGSITHTLTPMYRVGTKRGYSDPIDRPEFARKITLPPGGSYEYYLAGSQPGRCTILLGFSAGVPYGGCAFLRDENGNDSPQVCAG